MPIWTRKAAEWFFQSPPKSAPSIASGTYLLVKMKAMRLAYLRKGLKTFSGVLHSEIVAPHREEGERTYVSLITPRDLAGIAASATQLNSVVQLPETLAGPVPMYANDTDLGINIGLFSLEVENYLNPLLDVLKNIVQVAGFPILGDMEKYMEPFQKGFAGLVGDENSSEALEVGCSGEVPPKLGDYIAVKAGKNTLANSDVQYDESAGQLLVDGAPWNDKSYFVFSIEQQSTQTNFGRIPALRRKYRQLRELVRRKVDAKIVNAALEEFELYVRTSPDLTETDQQKVVGQIRDQVEPLLRGRPVSGDHTEDWPGLQDLYEDAISSA